MPRGIIYREDGREYVDKNADAPFIHALKCIHKEQHLVLVASLGVPTPKYQEIAASLEMPVGSVKSRLHRARKRILKWRKAKAETDARSHKKTEEV